MQFQTIITLFGLVATTVSATPTPAPNMVEILSTRDIAVNATLTLDAATCEPLKCLDVVAGAGCIVVAMGAGKPESALSCVASNTDKICNCAGCISGLGNFLSTHGVC